MNLIPVSLAKYKRAIYKNLDTGYNVTVTFPWLEGYRVDAFNSSLYTPFDFRLFIEHIKVLNLDLIIGETKYFAVRLHGFEYNQPVRIMLEDFSEPIIVVVLQVYISEQDVKLIGKQPMYLSR